MEVICFNGGHLIGRAHSEEKNYIYQLQGQKMSPFGVFALGLNLTVKDYNTVEIFVTKMHE